MIPLKTIIHMIRLKKRRKKVEKNYCFQGNHLFKSSNTKIILIALHFTTTAITTIELIFIVVIGLQLLELIANHNTLQPQLLS